MTKIIFDYIKFRNINSYGNNDNLLTFSNGLNLITGPNGTGKSSCLEGLCFCLYGKPYRSVKINEIINDKNKGKLYTEVQFRKGETVYKIIRTLKPDSIQIFENEKELDLLSHKKLIQEEIDKILGIDYNLFKQIITISINYNKPFLSLDSKDKRDILDSIFNIKVFSKMLSQSKKKNTILKQNLEVNDKQLETMKSGLIDLGNSIKKLEDAEKNFYLKRENDLKSIDYDISSVEKELESLNAKYNPTYDNYVFTDYNSEIDLIKNKIKIVEENIKNMPSGYANVTIRNEDHELWPEYKKGLDVLQKLKVQLASCDYTKKTKVDTKKEEIEISTFEREKKNINSFLEKLDKENGNCSVCGQEITGEHKESEKLRFNERLSEINSSISELKDKINFLVSEHNEKILNEFNKIQNELIEADQEIHSLIKKIESDTDIKNENSKNECEKLNKIQNELIEAERKKILKYNAEINELKVNEAEERAKYNLHMTIKESIGRNNDKLTSLKKKRKEIEISEFSIDVKKDVEEYKKKKELTKELFETTKNLRSEVKVYDTIKKILDDDGIKTYFFNNLIPILNKKVSGLVEQFNLPVKIEFSSSMEEKILDVYGKEISYWRLSEGEKRRIDLSILLSFIELNKLINRWNTNILIFDEILDSSLDSDGLESIIESIVDIINKDELCCMLISHRQLHNCTFNKIIKIEKNNGFSKITA